MSSLKTFAALCLAVVLAGPVLAQNPFEPVARVNESVITRYEVEQRVRFLTLLNAPDSAPDVVLNGLIEDRLRLQAARSFGLQLTDEALQEGMAELAGRANLTLEQFLAALGQRGVAPETLRDFVGVQLTWRDLIRGRFGNRVQISEEDVDRALAASSRSSGIRVLLSEIIMPAPAPQAQQVMARARQIAQSRSPEEFSSFARRFSATASRGQGGRLDWTPLNNLPPTLRPIILSLSPGEVTQPLPITNAVALFQLRAIEETSTPTPDYAAIEYAAYYIDGGRSPEALARARDLRARVDVCDDLYGIAKGQPEDVLDRGSLPPGDIPQDIAIELAKLDPGEVSTDLTRADGRTLVFLMLCGRTPALPEEADRDAARNALFQNRFGGFADAYMEELRASASIEILSN